MMKRRDVIFLAVLSWGTFMTAHEDDPEVTEIHRGLRVAAHTAVWEGDTVLFDALIKAGLQLNKPLDPDDGDTALHVAVSRGEAAMIRHLLKLGADPLAMNFYQDKPVDILAHRSDEKEVRDCLGVLSRELTDYDRRLLMGIPAPVWREVLGLPERMPDPLAPPVADAPAALVTFITINHADPEPEMKPVLDAHYPGWRPGSVIEPAEPPAGAKHGSIIRDKTTKQFGEHVQITLVESTSSAIRPAASDFLARFMREKDLPAFEFKVRRTRGGAMNGGGWGGYIVQLNGYWIKVGTAGWDE